MTTLDKIKRKLERWYGKKFTVYVGDTPFEVTPCKLLESIVSLRLKEDKEA